MHETHCAITACKLSMGCPTGSLPTPTYFWLSFVGFSGDKRQPGVSLLATYATSLHTVNPLLNPPGGLFFSSTFEEGLNREGEGGLKERGGLFNLAKHITCIKNTVVSDRVDLGCSLEFSTTGARFLEDGLVVPGRYTAFSNYKTMVTIPHRELERKVEKLKHMKLEVMPPKTKNNMNFQPE